MFDKVNLIEEPVSTYVRFSNINVQNPANSSPSVSVTIDTVADIAGTTVVVKSECVYLIPVELIEGYGFDGKRTTQDYSIIEIMLVLNSLGHAALNQPKKVYEYGIVDFADKTAP